MATTRIRALLCIAAALCAMVLTGAGIAPAQPRTPQTTSGPGPDRAGDWPGWQHDLSGSRFNSAEWRINPHTVANLKLSWAYSFPANGVTPRSQPAVVGDWIYFGGPDGRFHALDARSGQTRWLFDLNGSTNRTRPAVAEDGLVVVGDRVFFGDSGGDLYALDRFTGKLVWTTQLTAFPSAIVTSSPLFYHGRLYVGVSSGENTNPDLTYPCCQFRGQLASVDARTGRVLWRYYTMPVPSVIGSYPNGTPEYGPAGGGVWGSPTVDPASNTVFVGTGQNYSGSGGDFDTLLALDADSGAVRWKHRMATVDTWRIQCSDPTLPDGYCPSRPLHGNLDHDVSSVPNIFQVNGRTLVGVGQKSGTYHVLDARTGQVIWERSLSTPSPNGGGTGIQWGASYDGTRIYVATWLADPGTLNALDPATGRLLWRTPNPANGCSWGGAARYPQLCTGGHGPAVTTTPGLVYEGSADGKFRVYSARTGAVLWEYDTFQAYTGVNGLPGEGGSVSCGGGAVVAHGMVYLESGYWVPSYPATPGRGYVLLAFGL